MTAAAAILTHVTSVENQTNGDKTLHLNATPVGAEKHLSVATSKSSDNLYNNTENGNSAGRTATSAGGSLTSSSRNGSTKGSQSSNNNASPLNPPLSRESSTGKKRCAIPV